MSSAQGEIATHCLVIMVAVDESGQPVHVPEWVAQTHKDKLHRATAIKLMAMRKQFGDEMRIYL